jgi:hypothetical protein
MTTEPPGFTSLKPDLRIHGSGAQEIATQIEAASPIQIPEEQEFLPASFEFRETGAAGTEN